MTGSRLRTDRPVVAAAADNMMGGDWQGALHAMRPIGRISPYADLKTFARAMKAWEQQDRSTLKKALPRLGETFPFKGLRTLLAEHRKVLTNLYETMAAQFDDDPAPCLELARLYYLKNAFRKAQAILQTAYDRAPHDVRVKESRALAFVISVQKNLPKEKGHLVDRDLDRCPGCPCGKHYHGTPGPRTGPDHQGGQ